MVSKMLTLILQLVFLPMGQATESLTKEAFSVGCMIHRTLKELVIRDEKEVPDTLIEERGGFKYLAGDISEMSGHLCVTRCWNNLFPYAAVQGATRCYCAQALTDMISAADEHCNKRCPGACNEMCGGLVALSVYETGTTERVEMIIDTNLFMKVGFKGCFRAPFWEPFELCGAGHLFGPRNMEELVLGRMNPQLCVAHCSIRKVPYAILKTNKKTKVWVCQSVQRIRGCGRCQSADTCCCDLFFKEWIKKNKSVELDRCSIPCVGEPQQKCAGMHNRTAFFITAYDVLALLSEKGGFPEFNEEKANYSGYFYPIFAPNDNFEVKQLTPDVIQYLETSMGSRNGNQQRITRPGPIIDSENKGVRVVDVPQSETPTWKKALMIVLGIVGSLGLIGISYFFYQRFQAVTSQMELHEKKAIGSFLEQPDKTQKKKKKQVKGQKKSPKKQKKKDNKEWKAVPSSSESDT